MGVVLVMFDCNEEVIEIFEYGLKFKLGEIVGEVILIYFGEVMMVLGKSVVGWMKIECVM